MGKHNFTIVKNSYRIAIYFSIIIKINFEVSCVIGIVFKISFLRGSNFVSGDVTGFCLLNFRNFRRYIFCCFLFFYNRWLGSNMWLYGNRFIMSLAQYILRAGDRWLFWRDMFLTVFFSGGLISKGILFTILLERRVVP